MFRSPKTRYGLPGKNSEDRISKITGLLNVKNFELENLQYEVDILKAELLNVYRNEVTYKISVELHSAFLWFHAIKDGTIKGEKLDRRKKYPEKDSYEYVKRWIKNVLGLEEIEITGFLVSVKGRSYTIRFKTLDKEWELVIPDVENIYSCADTSGYEFMIKLFKREKHTLECVLKTFEEDKLKDLFKEVIEDGKK